MNTHKYVAEYGTSASKRCRLCSQPESAPVHQESSSRVPRGTDKWREESWEAVVGPYFGRAPLRGAPDPTDVLGIAMHRGMETARLANVAVEIVAYLIAFDIEEQVKIVNVALELAKPPRLLSEAEYAAELERIERSMKLREPPPERVTFIPPMIDGEEPVERFQREQREKARRAGFGTGPDAVARLHRAYGVPLASPAGEAAARAEHGDGDGSLPPHPTIEGLSAELENVRRLLSATEAALRKCGVLPCDIISPEGELNPAFSGPHAVLSKVQRELAEMTAQRDRWMRKESEANHHATKQCQKLEAQKNQAEADLLTVREELETLRRMDFNTDGAKDYDRLRRERDDARVLAGVAEREAIEHRDARSALGHQLTEVLRIIGVDQDQQIDAMLDAVARRAAIADQAETSSNELALATRRISELERERDAAREVISNTTFYVTRAGLMDQIAPAMQKQWKTMMPPERVTIPRAPLTPFEQAQQKFTGKLVDERATGGGISIDVVAPDRCPVQCQHGKRCVLGIHREGTEHYFESDTTCMPCPIAVRHNVGCNNPACRGCGVSAETA